MIYTRASSVLKHVKLFSANTWARPVVAKVPHFRVTKNRIHHPQECPECLFTKKHSLSWVFCSTESVHRSKTVDTLCTERNDHYEQLILIFYKRNLQNYIMETSVFSTRLQLPKGNTILPWTTEEYNVNHSVRILHMHTHRCRHKRAESRLQIL